MGMSVVIAVPWGIVGEAHRVMSLDNNFYLQPSFFVPQ